MPFSRIYISRSTPPLAGLATLWVWAVFLLTACGPEPQGGVVETDEGTPRLAAVDAGSSEPAPEVGREVQPAPLSGGFVVWESDRSRAWRLWIQDLGAGEATSPRRLTPNEHRIHCCPHVSPDGEWIAYLSLEPDQRGYPPGGGLGILRRIRPDGSGQEDLVPAARTYYEHRAAVWTSEAELIYIDGERRTMLLDLETGESTALFTQAEKHGYLLDPTLSYAATGLEGFHAYDPTHRTLLERTPFDGCQFYFSSDGRWGYWMAGAGGPLRRIELSSGEVETWLRKNDPRLPEGVGYMYFPMLSQDRSLLVLAASRDEHDHFRADYDVLAFEVDPETLELTGPARPVGWSPATDRFPDAWVQPLALGRHSGEAPLTLRLSAPFDSAWEWSFGDGGEARGREVEHRWQRPGSYEVRAASSPEGEALRGRVWVRPSSPPNVLDAAQVGSRELEVTFDEPISIERARFALESGIGVTSFSLLPGERRVHLRLARALATADTLVVESVEDRAVPPNRLHSTRLRLPPPTWPSDRAGLLFLWETGDAANRIPDPETGAERSVVLQARGRARLDHDFAMRPAGGSFVAPAELAARVRRRAQATNELSLEVVLEAPKDGVGTILELARGGRRLVRLRQDEKRLIFGILDRKWHERLPEVELTRALGEGKHHLAVTYSVGALEAFLDGKRLAVPDRDVTGIAGDFFHWRDTELRFGDGGPWQGTIEGVAFYDRLLNPDEVRENARRYAVQIAERSEVPQWRARVRQVQCAPTPTLASIAPYREALKVCRYAVVEDPGASLASEVDVLEWALLDGEELEVERGVRWIVLERAADNRQIESVYVEELGGGADSGELYYRVN